MRNDETVSQFVDLSKQLMAQAESDRDVQVKRLLEAGASPLMIDALLDVARKEMWAVLFSHLVEVAVQWQRTEGTDDGTTDDREYNAGKSSGIEDCIRNVFEYVHGGSSGNA